MVLKQSDLNKVRLSVGNRIGSKVMIRANKGRHKIVVTEGIIKETYPSIFIVEVKEDDQKTPRKLSFSYTDVLTRDVEMTLC